MKKLLVIIVLILSIVLGTACDSKKPNSDNDTEGLDFSQSTWDTVDNYNIEKVEINPTFQINKNVEESKSGVCPFTFFTDGMVLQRNSVNKVFGTANYDGGVAVEINGETYYGIAENGEFEVYLPPVKEGKNLTMTIYGENNKITVNNVCYGEVILFSGQSNMNWRMRHTIETFGGKQFLSYNGLGSATYIPTVEDDPGTFMEYKENSALGREFVDKAEERIKFDEGLRLMLLDVGYTEEGIAKNKTPRTNYDLDKFWQVATERNSILDCSMFAYYFAQDLRTFTNVPIGVIVAATGSTNTTTWVDRETFEQNKTSFPNTGDSTTNKNSISSHYNTFIAPMLGYKFGSYIWYQGEGECASNTYGEAFSAMVASYKLKADNPNMKTLVVSLPQYNSGASYPIGYSQNNYGTADKELGLEGGKQILGRANQQKLPALIENCAVSVSVNTGDFDDIHPSDKIQICYQATCSYLTDLYGFKDEELLYPIIDNIENIDGDVQINFKNVGEGLDLRNNGRGFQVSEDGKTYVQIKAFKVSNGVYLSAGDVGLNEIKYVKYGWLQFPRISRINPELYVSVFNSYGMPLDQFDICVADYIK